MDTSAQGDKFIVVHGICDARLRTALEAGGLQRVADTGESSVWCRSAAGGRAAAAVVSPAQPPTPALLTIPEAASLLGLSRSSTYRLIGEGRLEVVHVGRAARVPAGAIDDLITDLRRPAGALRTASTVTEDRPLGATANYVQEPLPA